jgi:DNA-binding NtrC family response regulator
LKTPVPGALRILVVDDDGLAARVLASNLARPGCRELEVVTSGAVALQRLAGGGIDAIVADLVMPGMDGIELTRRIREIDASLPVIVLTASASIDRAVEAMRAGASDFLQKPANVTVLQALIERAVAERAVREVLSARAARRGAGAEAFIRGNHPRLQAVREFAEQVAEVADARVLITGETGTGKSRLAQAIHDLSATSGRFIEINCATLPANLLESELFGHEKGSFTDARATKRGLAELADRGTLFLDEIGSLSLELQAKLLLFVERREIRRVGGTEPIPVRCRLITATHENLRQQVRDRAFRQDLLFRLDIASVEMPPLREMTPILPELAEAFMSSLCDEFNRPPPPLDPGCIPALLAHSWPGNLRELKNAVERALIFHRSGPLHVLPQADNPAPTPGSGTFLPWGLTLEVVERSYIAAMIERDPTVELGEIARQLGVSRKTLWQKRRRHGI